MKNRLFFFVLLIEVAGCCKPSETIYRPFGKIRMEFSHTVGGRPLLTDTLLYTTATGHPYMVADLQYFISDIRLYHDGGKTLQLTSDSGIHYIDGRIPGSMQWSLKDGIPPGKYDSLVFTFGINAAKNRSNRFPDPPERDMAWPDILGGGYHYMKMNLMYRSSAGSVLKPFMFHLGIGQVYSSTLPDPDSITAYVQNFFPVTLKTPVVITGGKVQGLQCIMQVDRWFDGIETFDFDNYPGGIMQYQEGMHRACVNGTGVFEGEVIR